MRTLQASSLLWSLITILSIQVHAQNVGIGTNTPLHKLHVVGGDIVLDRGEHVGASVSGHTDNGSTTNTFGSLVGATFTGMRVNSSWDGTYNDEEIAFYTHNGGVEAAERMRIDKSGNVGIGTITPNALLEVDGTTRITDLASGVNNAVVISDVDGDLSEVNFTGSSADVLLGNGTFGPSPGGDIDWYEGTTTTAPNAIGDHIYTQGNVGIGDFSAANPSASFHIKRNGEIFRLENGGGQAGFMTFHDDGGRIAYIGDGSSGSDHLFVSNDAAGGSGRTIMDYGDASNRSTVVLHEGGNVGIGTGATAPAAKLEVSGGARITSLPTGLTPTGVILADTDGDLGSVTLTDNTDVLLGDGTFGASPGEDIDWYEATTTTAPNAIGDHIYTQGNVGIGNFSAANPQVELDVNGTILAGGRNATHHITTLNGLESIIVPGSTSDYLINVQDGNGRIQHKWNATYGTGETFIVANEDAFFMDINATAATDADAYFEIKHDDGATAAAGAAIGWNTHLAITQGGNVGIGSSVPTHKLSVHGQAIEIENDDADSRMYFHDPGNNHWSVGLDQSNSQSFSINTGDALTSSTFMIETGGDVGIGTTNPTKKLEVVSSVNDGNTEELIRVTNTASQATGRVGIAFGNSTRPNTSTMARISAETGSGHNNAQMIFEVGDEAGQDLQERMTINERGEIFGKFRQVTWHNFEGGFYNPSGTAKRWLWFPGPNNYRTDANVDNRSEYTVFIAPYSGRIVSITIGANWGDGGSNPDCDDCFLVFARGSGMDDYQGSAVQDGTLKRTTTLQGTFYVQKAGGSTSVNNSTGEFDLDFGITGSSFPGEVVWKDENSNHFSFNKGDRMSLGWACEVQENRNYNVTVVWEYNIDE